MKPAAFVALAALAGFAIGLMWGKGTREALPGATQSDFSGGVLTVRVDARQALKGGLASLL